MLDLGMVKNVRIGTCGFGRLRQSDYVNTFSTVEIQHTFYQPPMLSTLEKWRAEASDNFEFTLKAWQVITHEATSPTYKRIKKKFSQTEYEEAGFFKPTMIVNAARDLTFECAKALRARTLLFQCPARFQPLPENILNFKQFFTEIERGDLNFAWEPRGNWDDRTIAELCEELDLWHCVNPFERPTLTPERVYYRLHGIPRWRYTFEDGELEELAASLPKNDLSYVFFNNITMKEDALRFETIVDRIFS